MSESSNSASAAVSIGLFWPVVFLALFLTGNCSTCGGDRDYVGDFVDREWG